jgi:hypothetical protein
MRAPEELPQAAANVESREQASNFVAKGRTSINRSIVTPQLHNSKSGVLYAVRANYLSSGGILLNCAEALHVHGGFLFCEVTHQFHQGVCARTRDTEMCPT